MGGWEIKQRIEEFRERLPVDVRGQFDDHLNEEINRRDLDAIKNELKQEYEQSEEHLELVTAVASAFHQDPVAPGYDSGFEFAFTEPLEERNSRIVGEEQVTNGDLLLVREDGRGVYLCIVECKSGQANGHSWLRELKRIKETIEPSDGKTEAGYKDTLAKQIGYEAADIQDIQYVLLGKLVAVRQLNYNQIIDDIDIEWGDSGHYAVWGFSTGEQKLLHDAGNIRHQDLYEVVGDAVDTGQIDNPIQFTYSDHSLTQLKTIIEQLIVSKKKEGDAHPYEFETSEFYHRFRDELQVGFSDNLLDRLVRQRTSHLIDIGEQIGIFTSDQSRINSTRDYRISFRGKKESAAKENAQKKYFQTRSELKRKKRAFDAIRDEFAVQQPTLLEFEEREQE